MKNPKIPGYTSNSEFAAVWGLNAGTVSQQLKAGYCRWPRHQINGNIKHPLYKTWENMNSRCYNPKAAKFYLYGGKGIRVCDEWRHDFKQFVNDMGPRPEGFTLDRINGDDWYSPENCRWASIYTQNQNQKRSKNIKPKQRGNSWRAEVTRYGKRFRKTFKTEIEAQNAIDNFIRLRDILQSIKEGRS